MAFSKRATLITGLDVNVALPAKLAWLLDNVLALVGKSMI